MATTTPQPATSVPHHTLAQGMKAMSGHHPRYYPRLIRNMSRAKSLAIFQRFDEINLLHLMSLQAEIVDLRERYKRRCKDDQKSNPSYERSFRAIRDSEPKMKGLRDGSCHNCRLHSVPKDEWENTQYGLIDTLRKKTSEYNSLIIQVSQLSQIGAPPKSQLQVLQKWLQKEGSSLRNTGDMFPAGAEYFMWNDSDEKMYYSLDFSGSENDSFTMFIKGGLLRTYHFFVGRKLKKSEKKDSDEESLYSYYEDSTLDTASGLIALIISSTLPVLTIFVLNLLTTTTARIGFTVLFTAVFSALLFIFTTAKRVEIFAATATFAAVEVVFIGSTLSCSTENSVST